MKKIYVLIFCLIASTAFGKAYWYNATSLAGGGDGAVDAINGQLLKNGDKVIVVVSSGQTYIYNLDVDSALTESSPSIISPDSNAGDKRWILMFKGGRIALPDATIDQGDSSISGTIAWHISNASGANTTVTVLPGTYKISTNITAPSTLAIEFKRGGVLKPDAAKRLVANSPSHLIASPNQKIVDMTNNSTDPLTFTNAGTVYPQWWGAVADGTTDDQPEIQAALDASVGGICKLIASSGEYIVGAPLVLAGGNRLIGEGTLTLDQSQCTIIKLDANVDDNVIETNTWTGQTGYCHWFEISNLGIDGNKANNASTSAGIAIYGMGETSKVDRVFINNANDYGIQLAGVGAPSRMSNISIFKSGIAAVLSSQTGASVTNFESFSGDDNIIFAKFTGGPIQAVFINPKIEGEHDPVFDFQLDDMTGNYGTLTVIGGYANPTIGETDILKTDSAGGSTDGVSATFINFRQYNYTNLINDVDNGQTYATGGLQTHAGIYQFMGKIRVYGDQSAIFVPYNVPILSEGSVEGTEFDMLKQGSSLVLKAGTSAGISLSESGGTSIAAIKYPGSAGVLWTLGQFRLGGTVDIPTLVIYHGSGTPESAVTANAGSLYLRSDGGANTTLYIKESGTGSTGWAAK